MPNFSNDIEKLTCTLCALASDWLYLFDLIRPPPHGVVPKEPTRLPPLADRGESIQLYINWLHRYSHLET